MGARHHHLSSDVVHKVWDNSLPPRVTVESGDTVTFQTRNAGDFPYRLDSKLEDVPRTGAGHPLTGPVWVAGAKPGDTLEVEVLELVPGAVGWTIVVPELGLLAGEFPTATLNTWDLTKDPTPFRPGISVPLEPFLGIMGVALGEPGSHSTMPPRRNAGNVDTKQLTVGAKVYIPVLVEGALFSCGDGHAAQGDGEVCVTAIETDMTATLRFTLQSGRELAEFQFQTGPLLRRTNAGGWYATTGHGPDLMEASRNAVRHMIAVLVERASLKREDAYMLCSVAVDLRISEVVDAPNWVVSAFLPLALFDDPSRITG
jgi:acetamidase/formamidase